MGNYICCCCPDSEEGSSSAPGNTNEYTPLLRGNQHNNHSINGGHHSVEGSEGGGYSYQGGSLQQGPSSLLAQSPEMNISSQNHQTMTAHEQKLKNLLDEGASLMIDCNAESKPLIQAAAQDGAAERRGEYAARLSAQAGVVGARNGGVKSALDGLSAGMMEKLGAQSSEEVLSDADHILVNEVAARVADEGEGGAVAHPDIIVAFGGDVDDYEE